MAILGFRDVLFLCFCGVVHFIYRYRRRPRLPLPPSLPGWPIVGNAFQIPLRYVHIFYQELERKLGSKIMYLEAFGQPIIVINDALMAKELLEKRSALYSSRPPFRMLAEVIKTPYLFAFFPYGDEWRNQRRILQQYFSQKTLYRQQDKALEFVRKGLLPNLYQDPGNIHEHMRECVGGLSISMTYGVPVKRKHDPFLQLSEEAFTGITAAAAPGTYLVNTVPILKHVPEWMPGATFKRVARKVRTQIIHVMEEPYRKTLKSMDDGSAPESFVSKSLESHRDKPDFALHESRVKQAAFQIFGAGSETTVASTMTFILAMLKYPEIQRKAQAEVDSVVGPDRLPDFSDMAHLPYLSAVLKEALRWNPIAPSGVPHMTSEEDVYGGYYIPKGALVMANTYAMLQDEETFPNPKEFEPERFIKDGVPLTDILDPSVIATFGFGRRICPGAHIALSILHIIAASVLSLFDISPAIDAEGKPIEVIPEFIATSIISEPLPFQCKVTPRQGKNVEGVLREYMGIEVI